MLVDETIKPSLRARDEQGSWRYGLGFCSWPGQAKRQLTRQVLRSLATERQVRRAA